MARLSRAINVTLPARTHCELARLNERTGLKRSAIIAAAVRAYALEHRVDCGAAPILEAREPAQK